MKYYVYREYSGFVDPPSPQLNSRNENLECYLSLENRAPLHLLLKRLGSLTSVAKQRRNLSLPDFQFLVRNVGLLMAIVSLSASNFQTSFMNLVTISINILEKEATHIY